MKTHRYTIMAALCLMALQLAAQVPTDSLSESGRVMDMMRKVKTFQKTYPQEKVYLHFDNTGYFKGERIYFKAYVRRTDTGKPTDISRVLYVDLLTPNGDVIRKGKLRIENGEADGSISVDTLFTTGFYEVRAYTRYMMNFGDETAFSRVLPVFREPEQEGNFFNPVIDYLSYYQRLPEREMRRDSLATLHTRGHKERKGRGYTVNVYPEGGWMVKGLLCRVAFSVLDSNRQPVELAGEVVDEEGNMLTIVTSGEDGKGIFEFVPTSRKLSMILTTPDLKKLEFDMPDVLEDGVAMSVDAVSGNRVHINIQSTDSMVGQQMGLTVMNDGNIYRTDTLRMKDHTDVWLHRNGLEAGVNQVTLFDSRGHVHAERLFFICPDPSGNPPIEVEALTEEVSPCGKVRLRLHSAPKAHYSVSVMDAETMPNGKYGNINTYMLLSSDVRGYIPDPDYYFEADDEEHRLAADKLMLFNGWRRYDWQVMAGTTPWTTKHHQIEDDQYVYGRLKPALSKWRKNNPVGGVDLSLYIYKPDSPTVYGNTVTDSTGFYAFRLPDGVYGDWNMQIQTRIDDKRKSYAVTVDRHFKPKPRFISDEEARMVDFPTDYLRFTPNYKAFDSVLGEPDSTGMRRTGKNTFIAAAATVTGKKTEQRPRSMWFDEHNARRHASLYYDCEDISEAIADEGQQQPPIDDWLRRNNPLFSGQVFFSNGDDESLGSISGDATYNDRDIMWMVNNHWVGTTGRRNSVLNSQIVKVTGDSLGGGEYTGLIPTFMDEVKSAYIWSSQDSRTENVVVYLYTYPWYDAKVKGCRNTYFQGYDVPVKFTMDDYSILPPQPSDFRRTLYWNPSVTANSLGNATLEFYNNSTGSVMYVSAEGVTPDGVFTSTK